MEKPAYLGAFHDKIKNDAKPLLKITSVLSPLLLLIY